MRTRMRKIARLGVIFGVLIVLSLFLPQQQIAVASPDIETIRPTDAYNPAGFATPGAGYDGNTNTSASKTNLNAIPGISFGGDVASETVDDWQSKSYSWDSATIYIWFSKTAGTDDKVEVLVTHSDETLVHTIVASTAGAVTKQEFSQALSLSDWGGTGYSDIYDLRVRVNGEKRAAPDGATAYVYDIRIEGSYTPPIISITVTDGAVAYGTVAVGATEDTTASGVNDTQTATNNGNVAEEFQIKSSNAIGGTDWTLGAAQGDNTFTHKASIDDGSTWDIAMTAADVYVVLKGNVAVDGTQTFDLQIGMPTTITDYGEHTITVTVLATAA